MVSAWKNDLYKNRWGSYGVVRTSSKQKKDPSAFGTGIILKNYSQDSELEVSHTNKVQKL
jgi:hypothetical protein